LTSFRTVPSVSSSIFASGFFFAGRFHFFSLVVAPTRKIALESLWRMVDDRGELGGMSSS
jgi:hypothetical protein